MQDNNREMPKIDADLFFTIDEKNNQIELTDKGIEHLSKDVNDSNFFILPDISTKISEIENKNLKPENEAEKKEKVYTEFSLKSEKMMFLGPL